MAGEINHFSLEEQLWFQRRRDSIRHYVFGGSGIGACTMLGFLSKLPKNRATWLTKIFLPCAGATIGAGSGFLYADSKALNSIPDTGGRNRLRSQYET